MRVWHPAIVVGVALLCAAVEPGRAQTTDPSVPALLQAKRALNEGRNADVETILRAAAPDDPDAAALRARAADGVGREDEARAILKIAAERHPDSDAALELGLLLRRAGRKDDAARALAPLASLSDPDSASPADLVRAGRAARALGKYQAANDYLRRANALAPADADANIAWGALFLEKHNREDALRCFQAALAAEPRRVDAMLGMAQVHAEENLAEALRAVRAALQVNASSPDAHVLMAEFLMDAGYPDAARLAAERALAVNGRCLGAHAVLASIAYLQNGPADFDRAVTRALAIDKNDGEIYRVVAEQAAHHYRFDDAATLARKAVALDPGNARARADLGMDLLRIGEEEEARSVLKQAFDADPYNAVTYNLLAVLDALKDFETVRDGELVVRLDRRESAVLSGPVVALARDALKTLSAKYGFAPKGPILIEIFPHHDDFAVRNLGLPGLLGALGACFGRVVTMDSPRAQPPGTFEWSATLWHELTHVITLQMSNQRIPRWLTEGISVHEEQRARAEWRRPMEEAFVHAMATGQVPAIRDIDASFGDPQTIAIAYYQAGLIVDYLVDRYGQPRLNALIRGFADGLDGDAAFTRALGDGLDTVQAGFARSLDASFGPLRRALEPPIPAPLDKVPIEELKTLAAQRPDNYEAHLALGLALRRTGDTEAAEQAIGRAARLFPNATGTDSPHALLAELALERGDQPAALDEMDKQLAAEPVNVELARRMAGLLGEDAPVARSKRVYERITAIDPFDGGAHAALGKLAMKSADTATAVRELNAAVAAGASDASAIRCDLAEAYLAAGNPDAARREVVKVLEANPSYARAQDLLLRVVGGNR